MPLHHRRPFTADATPDGAACKAEAFGGLQSLSGKAAAAYCDGSSSTASETIPASFCLQGPSEQVLLALRMKGQEKGEALLAALQQACSLLLPRSPFTPDLHRQVKDKLQALHITVVDLDVALETLDSPAACLEECRHWLEEVQGYVLHLTRSMDTLASGSARTSSTLSSSSSSSSLNSDHAAAAELGSGNGANNAAAESSWAVLCADAHEALSKAAEQLLPLAGASAAAAPCSGSQQAASAEALGSPLLHQRSRLVYRVARMPYNTYWAKKVAI